MIENKLQYYTKTANYEAKRNAGEIPTDAIVFVEESNDIIVRGKSFKSSSETENVINLSGEFGDSEKIGIHQKKLTETYNEITKDLADVDIKIKDAINTLDSVEKGTSVDNKIAVQITETDGKIADINVTTNDIASATDLSNVTSRVTALERQAPGQVVGGVTEQQVNDKITAAINALDAVASGTSADGKVKVEVTETDGKVTGVKVTTDGLGSGTFDDATLKAVEKKVTDEQNARENADNDILRQLNEEKLTRQSADSTLQGNLEKEQQARENEDENINTRITELDKKKANLSTTYTKEEVNGLISTKDQNFVSVEATQEISNITDILPPTGAGDTIYRAGNWDGEKYAENVYSEYAWSTTTNAYVKLSTKNSGIDEKPTIDSKRLVESGGVFNEIKHVSAELGEAVVSLNAPLNVQYIKNIPIENNKVYNVLTDGISSNMQEMGWQIFGVKDNVDTAIFGCYPTATKELDTKGLEYDTYWLRIVQDVTDGTFNIYLKDSFKEVTKKDINNLNTNIENIKSELNDLDDIITKEILNEHISATDTGNVIKSIDTKPGKTYRITYVDDNQMSATPNKGYSLYIHDKNNAEIGKLSDNDIIYITPKTESIWITNRHKKAIGTLIIEECGSDLVSTKISIDDFLRNQTSTVNNEKSYQVVSGETVIISGEHKKDEEIIIPIYNGNVYVVDGTYPVSTLAFQIYGVNKKENKFTVIYGFYGNVVNRELDFTNFDYDYYYIRVCSDVEEGTLKIKPKVNIPDMAKKLDDIGAESVEYVTITVNSDPNSDADFKGNNAFRDAFASITDASPKKIYTIQARGYFEAKSLDDYIPYTYDGISYVFFNGKDYVNIDGGSSNLCVIKASLPDTVSENQKINPSFKAEDYGWYQPLFWNCKGNVSNITFIARNVRYPLHIDNSGGTLLDDFKMTVKNCVLIHEGKYGDSVGTIGGGPTGFATSQGMSLVFENCIFEGATAKPYGHDNRQFKRIGEITYRGCIFKRPVKHFQGNEKSVINFECLSEYNAKSILNIEDCLLPEGTFIRGYRISTYSKVNNADSICCDVNIDSEPIAVDEEVCMTRSLCITSATTGKNSSVRVDQTSSAFDAIFGYSNQTVFIENNKYCRRQQYGYQYKDGGDGLAGIAIGTVNVSNAKWNDTYMNLLGKRLGDCSSVHKELVVIVDGVRKVITFNKNYDGTSPTEQPLIDGQTIINEMNQALGGAATVAYYNLDRDWFPNFKKGVEILFNGDTEHIKAGMGVVINGDNTVRKATRSDMRIDGIAIDSAACGDNLRVIRSGYVSYDNSRYGIYKKAGSPTYDNVEYGKMLSLSDTAGIFEVSDECPVLRKSLYNSVKIL